jgi:hypothetical protein
MRVGGRAIVAKGEKTMSTRMTTKMCVKELRKINKKHRSLAIEQAIGMLLALEVPEWHFAEIARIGDENVIARSPAFIPKSPIVLRHAKKLGIKVVRGKMSRPKLG